MYTNTSQTIYRPVTKSNKNNVPKISKQLIRQCQRPRIKALQVHQNIAKIIILIINNDDNKLIS